LEFSEIPTDAEASRTGVELLIAADATTDWSDTLSELFGKEGTTVDELSFLQINFLPYLIHLNFVEEEIFVLPNFEHEEPLTGVAAWAGPNIKTEDNIGISAICTVFFELNMNKSSLNNFHH